MQYPLVYLVLLILIRYTVDIAFDKVIVNKDALKDLKGRRRARYEIKKKLEERYAWCVWCVFY